MTMFPRRRDRTPAPGQDAWRAGASGSSGEAWAAGSASVVDPDAPPRLIGTPPLDDGNALLTSAPPTTAAPPAAAASPPTSSDVGRDPSERAGRTVLLLAIAIAGVAAFTAFLVGPDSAVWALFGALGLIVIVQLGIIGLAVRERRRLARGVIVATLAITLLVNPLTLGGVRAVLGAAVPSSEAGNAGPGTDGTTDDADLDPIWKSYPGSRFTPPKDVIDGANLETYTERSDAMLADLRAALTAEFGFEWVQRQPAKTEKDGNGFGGDSMLSRYTAPVWQTTTALTDIGQKNRAVEIIRQVAQRYGIVNLSMQNAPSAWRQPGELTEQFGGETLETQALWSLNAYDAISSGGRFSADIVDLSIDTTGTVKDNRYFDITNLTMAPDGIELHVDSSALLAEADRAAFIAALKPFDGLTVPK